ncbi:LacI family DNA-binding transcriptional regulator [Brachybacterium tyrofermentans]
MPERNPTLFDVAKAAGVSKSAASRALLRQSDVNGQTAERVREAARQLGYVPNGAARSLVERRSGIVGAHVRDVSSPFYGIVLSGMQAQAAADDVSVVSTSGSWDLDVDQESRLLKTLITLRADAIVVCSSTFPTPYLVPFLKRIPMVLCGWPEDDDRFSGCFIDEEDGAHQIADRIIDLGHRSVAIVRPPPSRSRSQARRMETIRQRLLTSHSVVREVDGGDRRVAMHDIVNLARERRVTVVMCPTNDTALEIIDVLRSSNLAVPEDVSVTGFDTVGPLGTPSLGISSFTVPAAEVGRRALAMALERIDNPDQPPQRLLLNGNLRIGSSAAAPPASGRRG